MSKVKISSIVTFFIFFSCSNFNRSENTHLYFKKYVHDFGNIKFKVGAEYDFHYINLSNRSLSIKFVRMNCGCLSSKWSEGKIVSNAKGKITIRKDTGIPGVFEDRILVYYNELSLPDTLIIKGKVVYP